MLRRFSRATAHLRHDFGRFPFDFAHCASAKQWLAYETQQTTIGFVPRRISPDADGCATILSIRTAVLVRAHGDHWAATGRASHQPAEKGARRRVRGTFGPSFASTIQTRPHAAPRII